jgi:hypothetical protein
MSPTAVAAQIRHECTSYDARRRVLICRGVPEESPAWDDLIRFVFWACMKYIDEVYGSNQDTHKDVSEATFCWAYDHVSPDSVVADEVHRFELVEQDRRRVERELDALS